MPEFPCNWLEFFLMHLWQRETEVRPRPWDGTFQSDAYQSASFRIPIRCLDMVN